MILFIVHLRFVSREEPFLPTPHIMHHFAFVVCWKNNENEIWPNRRNERRGISAAPESTLLLHYFVADSSGRAIATAAATAAVADESAHDQESDNSDSSPDQDIRHSAPRFSFVVRNPLASRPLGRTRLSSRRRTLCTILVSLSVVVTTELQIFSFRICRRKTLHLLFSLIR